MKRIVKVVVICAVFLMSFPAGAFAQGMWAQHLRNNYCGSRHQPKGWGCAAYIYYRISQGKDKDYAKRSCYYGCGQIHPNSLGECKQGCDEANAKDGGPW